uniref:HECT-type E3 ubiquitin transferase n=2 Tax=Eptatretus burgeri TaxID=7764 RepID=A0A8C4WWT8_EPTBU
MKWMTRSVDGCVKNFDVGVSFDESVQTMKNMKLVVLGAFSGLLVAVRLHGGRAQSLSMTMTTWLAGRRLSPFVADLLTNVENMILLVSIGSLLHLCWELGMRIISFMHHCRQRIGATPCHSFKDFLLGRYLDSRSCKIKFHWDDPHEVGHSMCFTVHLFYKNGRPYPAAHVSTLTICVCHHDTGMEVPLVQEVVSSSNIDAVHVRHRKQNVASSAALMPEHDRNVVTVSFVIRKAGKYMVLVRLKEDHVFGSPALKTFKSGPVDPNKTRILGRFSTLVLTEDTTHVFTMAPHDEYENPTDQGLNKEDDYALQLSEIDGSSVSYVYEVCAIPDIWRLAVSLTVYQIGTYMASLQHCGRQISNGNFGIIVLSKDESVEVDRNVCRTGANICFEAYLDPSFHYPAWFCSGSQPSSPCKFVESQPGLLAQNPLKKPLANERTKKLKKVYCYVSPKQLVIKEFYFKLIPWRLATFRVCHGTKFSFRGLDPVNGLPTLLIDDGMQSPIEIACQERNVLAATYTRFLLRSIGGSESFQDKVNFFHQQVRQLHGKYLRRKVVLEVDRFSLLESSMSTTSNFSANDWLKNFEIRFKNEEAMDFGGPRREWFEKICKALFDPANNLFVSFQDTNQALVHPNPDHPTHLQLKTFEFAGRIVGKCLYETALGAASRQLVHARFTRSFLAQLIGLPMHYRYFKTDNQDFYKSKVSYILNNDISSMELTFSEEVYSAQGHLDQVVDLIQCGSTIPVTNDNKYFYLNQLAQYRLATKVRVEVESFLKGLNDLVPENLLIIFDENELELLMCGMGSIDVEDFQKHTVVQSYSNYFMKKVMPWFWTVVASLTQEELARLLQFSTGSSQLPPGGFLELTPTFQIIASTSHGTLPTAHTCFNQLCLPTYDSCQELHKMLKIAITEGSEGFGYV